MIVAVTGTPGTGKTTASERLATRREDAIEVAHLNERIREGDLSAGIDDERGSLIADLDALETWFEATFTENRDEHTVLVESHLAHHLPVDRVVVLRCRPDRLESRLRGRTDPLPDATGAEKSLEELVRSIAENAESEALDVVLSEAIERHGRESVYEIDTTDRGPEAVAAAIGAVIDGERTPSAGTVSFLEYLSS